MQKKAINTQETNRPFAFSGRRVELPEEMTPRGGRKASGRSPRSDDASPPAKRPALSPAPPALAEAEAAPALAATEAASPIQVHAVVEEEGTTVQTVQVVHVEEGGGGQTTTELIEEAVEIEHTEEAEGNVGGGAPILVNGGDVVEGDHAPALHPHQHPDDELDDFEVRLLVWDMSSESETCG